MAFETLNKIARAQEFVPLNSLEKNQAYNITGIRKLTTKYGDRIVVELNENECAVFLPNRVVKLCLEQPEVYSNMQRLAMEKKLIMKYEGGRYNNVQFSSM